MVVLRAYDPAVTMFNGPSRTYEPLEVGVVTDEEGTAVIRAMRARRKFLEGSSNEQVEGRASQGVGGVVSGSSPRL